MMVVNVYADDLQVAIVSARSKFSKTQNVTVHVQYSNTGNKTIYIHKWCLPDNELNDPLFKITCNGAAVNYIGRLIKRRTPTIDDVTPLAPGKTILASVGLSSAYDMSKTCNYSIQYSVSTERVVFKHAQTSKTISNESISNFQSDLESNNIQLNAEGRPNLHHEQNDIINVRKRAATLYSVSCSATQNSQIISAVSSALNYARNSFNYLSMTTPSGTNRYKTWFDTYMSTNWNTVKRHYQNIQAVLNGQRIILNCGCTMSGTYAYVYPNQPYTIYLCSVFWSAPTTGTDSKAGTLVHEISHFTVVADTDDYVYGQTRSNSFGYEQSIESNHECRFS
ncbi:unnamed protein product [Rotaria sp. Silwood1]|nr:unnamed protein product [Rotaria sp. Silwood1]